MASQSGTVLGFYALVIVWLGLTPNLSMDRVAAFARSFLHGHPPEHAVAYFSAVNLKGAAISITIGLLVYLLVVRRLLIRNGQYRDPIPKWLNLEYGVYRPVLRFLAQTAIVLATLVDRILPRLLFHGVPRAVEAGYKRLLQARNRLVTALTGRSTPQTQRGAGGRRLATSPSTPMIPGGRWALSTPWPLACCSPALAWCSGCCSSCFIEEKIHRKRSEDKKYPGLPSGMKPSPGEILNLQYHPAGGFFQCRIRWSCAASIPQN